MAMKDATARLGAALALVLAAAGTASAQVHPSKSVFADAESWLATGPGEAPLANFEPFRAVYQRVYRDAQGGTREDRVIITAERVAWGQSGAILVTLVDAGSLEYDDTTARVQTRIFGEESQALLFHISPVPGTAKDYLLLHPEEEFRGTQVAAATGEGTVRSFPAPIPQLGAPALWVVGSMTLAPDTRIRFTAADAPAASNILGARPFLVAGRETVDAGPVGRRDAWVVRYPLGMDTPRAMENLVTNRPPYLLGKRPIDLETGETTEIGTLRLIEFSTFPGR